MGASDDDDDRDVVPGRAVPSQPVLAQPVPLRVVFLVNFLAPNLREVLQLVASRVRSLTVLESVPMEADRHWQPDRGRLDVVVQRTITRRRTESHPGGFVDTTFVHVPYDTPLQLRRLAPDVVVSLELGPRSIFAALHAHRPRRRAGHVLVVFGSERSEAGRSGARLLVRRALARAADVVTHNGPSGQRYLRGVLRVPDERLGRWDYAADPHKIHTGELAGGDDRTLRLLTIGQLVDRKGVRPALDDVIEFATARPDVDVAWTLVGSGPLATTLRDATVPASLRIEVLGHHRADEIRDRYAEHEVLLFPTMSDEWGLVAEEALGSGLAVLGSVHSQAVETLVTDGCNGFTFDPERPGELTTALERWCALSADERMTMRRAARVSVRDRTPAAAADQLVAAIARAAARAGRSAA